jgi:hypothetical protein
MYLLTSEIKSSFDTFDTFICASDYGLSYEKLFETDWDMGLKPGMDRDISGGKFLGIDIELIGVSM